MAPRTRRWTIACVFLTALAVRLAFWSAIHGTALDAWHRWDQTDMATYLTQSERIAAGDWLGRHPYHPYAEWQTRAGTEADWLRWYGPHAFHQAPLYGYLLALASKVTPRFVEAVKLLQVILGAGTCALVAGLSGFLFGRATALPAGLVAAFYGPILYLEPQLLREGPAIFVFTLLVWLLMRWSGRPVGAPRYPWILALMTGVLLGVYATFYEMATVVGAAAVVVIVGSTVGRSWRAALIAVAALVVGGLIGFAPLLARNLAVGGSPFETSSRLGVNLAYANMADAAGGGVFFTAPGPQLATIMDASGGTVTGILREVVNTYGGFPGRLLVNLGRRFTVLWAAVELPDNTSFEFYRREVPLLRGSITFAWIFPPAAAGLVLLVVAARASGGRTERRTAHGVVVVVLTCLVGALVVVHPQARYRLFLVPLLIPYAVACVARLVQAARERERRVLGAGLVLITAFACVQQAISAVIRPVAERPVDYAAAAHLALDAGDSGAAVRYYLDGLDVHPREVALRAELARLFVSLGRVADAAEQMKTAAALRPDLPELSEAADRLQRDASSHAVRP